MIGNWSGMFATASQYSIPPTRIRKELLKTMKSSIDAQIEFSFKGEDYSLSAHIDLDDYLKTGALPPVHAILAKMNGIDTYSYLFEVMEHSEITFDSAHGLAAEFLHDGNFDVEGFSRKWREQRIASRLQPIASAELGIDDLERHPQLKNALTQAYLLGKSDA